MIETKKIVMSLIILAKIVETLYTTSLLKDGFATNYGFIST
ncbi:hypothetical protein PLAN_40423 [Planktothrix rubescens CCAP 1459/22]|uniref:Uncharacterized protein n=1 Tax=Planktothrix rubescens CCAP 1459/22 TaxID=329571 RepID=A0A6J7ZN23_PLARU|nr:hypothetical protein PLAN_40423 [Planktothrix rubescens NIVA-CYA 18]